MRATLLTPLAVLALLVGGCTSDDPDPAPPTSSSPTPSDPTTSPTPTETETAAAEGPKAFIRRFVQVKNEMVTSGKTSKFEALSGPECQYCSGLRQTIRDIYKAGGSAETRGWQILGVGSAEGSESSPDFVVDVKSHPTEYTKSSGGTVQTLPGERTKYHFYLARGPEGWFITEVSELSS